MELILKKEGWRGGKFNQVGKYTTPLKTQGLRPALKQERLLYYRQNSNPHKTIINNNIKSLNQHRNMDMFLKKDLM